MVNGLGLSILLKSNLVEYWNKFPYVTKHKNSKKQTYKKALKYFSAMRKGQMHKYFGEKFYTWCEWNDVDIRLITKPLTDKDIMKGIDHLSLVFNPDYYPMDKTNLGALHKLIYDPYYDNSWFFLYFHKPPPMKYEVRKRQAIEKLSVSMQQKVIYVQGNLDACRGIDIEDTSRIVILIQKIREFYKEKKDLIDYNLCPNYFTFLDMYIDFVFSEYKGWGKLTASLMYPGKTIFKRFLKHYEKQTKVDLNKT